MKGATPEGTRRYASAHPPAHFRAACGWTVSSIGLGTYLGAMDEATDRGYADAARLAFERGCNLFDTAINYRYQRSERALGEALKGIPRDEVIVATKAGFPSMPGNFDSFARKHPGILGPGDVVGGIHCMAPKYLEHQIGMSLANLGIQTVDIFYLHNPETQLSELPRPAFLERVKAAFAFLETQVRAGRIRVYGAATWNGFRVPPQQQEHLSLEELLKAAREAGGPDHHFRAVQLPLNLAMPEAATLPTQGGKTLLEAAAGMLVCSSASILQGRLAKQTADVLEKSWPDLRTKAQVSLQFARSAPGLTTALVGMSTPAHVEENLELARRAPDSATVRKLLAE